MTFYWPEPDKREHFIVGFFAGLLIAFMVDSGQFGAAYAAWGIAMVPGVLKEFFDKADGHGQASVDDLVWDALGAAAGVWVAYVLMWMFNLKGVIAMEWIVGIGVAGVYYLALRVTGSAPEGSVRNTLFKAMGGGGKGVPQ